NQGVRSNRLNVLRGHTLTHNTLHTAESRTDLVLDQLTDSANTAVAEVINIIGVKADLDRLTVANTRQCLCASVQADQVLDRRDNIFERQHRISDWHVETELAVDLVATDLCEIITLGVEIAIVE